MGLSLENQVNTREYFSISTISKQQMKNHGITISISKLKELARIRPPAAEIYTGSSDYSRQRRTKVYRYDDFRDVQCL